MTKLPTEGRLAGIDYGTVRIGIAISDPRQHFASPLENYTRAGEAADAGHFQRLAREEEIVGFVVGLPVHGDGTESAKSRESRQFAQWLAGVTNCPTCVYDERYSTVQAEQLLGAARMTRKQRKKRLDMIAAQLILTAFLDSNREADPPRALDG